VVGGGLVGDGGLARRWLVAVLLVVVVWVVGG